jgi:hypothetical protein
MNAVQFVMSKLSRKPSAEPQPYADPEMAARRGIIRPNRDSEVKARYALALLGVAQMADCEAAARLVEHLIKDGPRPDERPEIADLHFRAIDVFKQLALRLRDPELQQRPPWRTAKDATTHWLDMVTQEWTDSGGSLTFTAPRD